MALLRAKEEALKEVFSVDYSNGLTKMTVEFSVTRSEDR